MRLCALAGLICVVLLVALLASTASAAVGEDNDFVPGLGIAAFLFIMTLIVVCMVLMGLGLAAGIVVCAAAAMLAGLGIVSSSAAVGLLRRSPSSAFRALFIQLGAAAGIPCGIGAAWSVSALAHAGWSRLFIILLGGGCGMACGIGVALLFNFVWGRIVAWWLERNARRMPMQKEASS